jgi:hypothetical protein
MIRFIHHFNYPSGVSRADGEAWYLGTHVPLVRELPGVVRYRSWAAARRIPGSLGRSPCASVVITQRAQLRSIFRRTQCGFAVRFGRPVWALWDSIARRSKPPMNSCGLSFEKRQVQIHG